MHMAGADNPYASWVSAELTTNMARKVAFWTPY